MQGISFSDGNTWYVCMSLLYQMHNPSLARWWPYSTDIPDSPLPLIDFLMKPLINRWKCDSSYESRARSNVWCVCLGYIKSIRLMAYLGGVIMTRVVFWHNLNCILIYISHIELIEEWAYSTPVSGHDYFLNINLGWGKYSFSGIF